LRLNAVSPMRLAVSLQLGLEEDVGVRLRVDGAAGDSHIVLTAGQEGTLGDFGYQALNISSVVTNPDGRALVRQLVGEDLSKYGVEQGVGSFRLDVGGTPQNTLRADITLETTGLSAFFKGIIKAGNPELEIDGIVDLKSKSAGLGLSLVGLKPSFEVSNSEIDLKMKLRKTGTSYQLKDIKGNWGGSEIGANVVYDPGKQPKLLGISANATQASVPGILGLSLQHKPRTILDLAREAVDESPKIWSNRPFDKAFFGDFQGTLKLRASELRLNDGITLKNGSLEASLKDERIQLTRLEGRVFEGKFSGQGELKNTLTGVHLEGRVSLENAQLDRLVSTKGEQPLANGEFGIEAKFSGQGLSPNGLISVLSGEGRLTLGDGEIPDLSPLALPEAIAQAALNSKTGDEGSSRDVELSAELQKKLKGRSFPFASMAFPVNIANGSVSIDKVNFASAGTSVEVKTFLELVNLSLNSEWMLESQQPGLKSKLPPVRMSFNGYFPEVGYISPELNTKDLDQFLTVSRMEQSVAELERLQRLEKELIEKENSRRLKDVSRRRQRIKDEEEARRKAALLEEQLQKQENLTLDSPPGTGSSRDQGFVTNSVQLQKPLELDANPLGSEDVPLPPKPKKESPESKPVWSPFKEFFENSNIFGVN